MQALGRELEITALETEIRGLNVEIEVTTSSEGLEAERAELQIKLEALRDA